MVIEAHKIREILHQVCQLCQVLLKTKFNQCRISNLISHSQSSIFKLITFYYLVHLQEEVFKKCKLAPRQKKIYLSLVCKKMPIYSRNEITRATLQQQYKLEFTVICQFAIIGILY